MTVPTSPKLSAPQRPPPRYGLAWVPVPALLALILGLWIADLRTPYESRAAMVLLNVFFTWLASLCICILTARGFLASGQPGVLMFGCGSLVWGATSLAAAMIVDRVNPTITVHNVGVLAAACCHAAGLLWLGRLARPVRWLVAGYAAALALSALIFWAAMAAWTPVFFVQGQGGTAVRQTVLLLAVVLFAWVAWQVFSRFRRHAGDFYYWYGLGLALTATGLTGVFSLIVQGGILGWTNRLTQYLGCAYLFVAAMAAVRETGSWTISLAAMEEAWRRAEMLPTLRKEPMLRLALRYGFAAVVVAAALALRLALTAWVGPGLPVYITFYPAVAVVALMAGVGPALLATALTSGIAGYWFFPPVGQFAIASPVDRLALIIFIGMGVFMGAVAELYRRNRQKVADYEREAAVSRGQKTFAELIERSPFGTYIVDSQFRIAMMNTASQEGAFRNVRPVIGRPFDEAMRILWPEPVAAEIIAHFRHTLDTGEPYFSRDFVNPRADAEIVEAYEWELHRMTPPDGQYGVICYYYDSTKLRQAEAATRQSELKYRRLHDSIRDAFVVVDMDGRIQGCNEPYREMLAYTEEELRRLTYVDLTPPRWHEMEARIVVEQILPQGSSGVYEKEYRRKDGTVFPVELRTYLMRDDAGQPHQMWAVVRDITARKQAEQRVATDLAALTRMHALSLLALERGEIAPLLQEIMDTAVAIMGADKGTLQLVDGGTLRIEAQHGHARPFLGFFAAAENVASVCGEATKRGERVVVEDVEQSALFAGTASLPVLRAAGVRAVQSTPLRTRDGKLLGILTTHWPTPHRPDDQDLWRLDLLVRQAADLIDREQAEETLRESEERLRLAMQGAHGGAWEVNLATYESWWSPELFELWGVEPGTPLPKETALQLIHEEDRQRVMRTMEDAVAGRTAYQAEFRIRHSALGVRWMAAQGHAICNSAGLPLRLVGITFDITERTEAEAALRQSREDLERAQAVGQVGSWRLDTRRNILTWSDENHRIFGLPKGAPMSYETFLSTIHPDDLQYVDAQWQAGLHGAPYDIEHRIVVADQVRWVREKAYLEFDTAGQLLGGFGITQDITARKQAETALRASEEKYRNLFASMAEEVHFWQLVRDAAGQIKTWRLVDANPPTLKSWGRQSVEEIRGQTTDEIFGPGATEHYLPVVRKIMTDGVPHTFEDYFPNLDKHFRFTSVPLGEFFITTGTDITRIKKAQEEVEEAYGRLKTFFDVRIGGIGIVIARADGSILQANDYYLDILGHTRQEFEAGKVTWIERTPPEWLPADERALAQLNARGACDPYEKEYIRHDGTRVPVLITDVMMPGPDKEILAIVVSMAERKRAEEALRASETRLRHFYDSPLLGVMYWNMAGHITEANDKFLEMVGYTREDLTTGRIDWAAMTPPEFRHLDEASVTELKATGVNKEPFEKEYIRKDGSRLPILVAGAMWDEARFNGVAFVLDITQRKQAEEELRRLNATLDQRVLERTAELTRAVQQLSIQSQQLRSLASELTLVEQRERVRLATQIHDGLQQLLVAARLRVVDMVGRAEDAAVRQDGQEISSLLAEALVDSRSLTAELSPPVLRTGGLRAGLEWLARWSQEKHHLTVQVTAPALPLPTLPEDLTVLLFQAVRELLFNAVKYAQVPAVAVTLEWDAPSLTLTVTDAGIGFDPHGLRGEGGSGGGFGLASIRHRLELLGGCMTISSAPGQGTQITLAVRLPTGGQPAAAPALPSPTASPQTALAPAPGSPRTIRILLVDDHEVVRKALAQLLRATPDLAVVGEAGTGTAAVALARQLVPEVVLMDINLPGMNGIETTRLIHVEFPSIRVIGLSMFDRGDQQAAMQAAGAVAYVSKSAPPDALLAAIRGRTGGAGGEDVSARG